MGAKLVNFRGDFSGGWQIFTRLDPTVGGNASNVQLENENGSLVYSVKIGQQDVKVDAGNGKVLYAENDNQQEDKNEDTRPKSSIQLPDTGDGDRETNDDK